MISTVEFNGKEFPIREIDIPEYGNILVSTTALNDSLMNSEGRYSSDKSTYIDEQIYYFVEESEKMLNENKLKDILDKIE